MYLTDPDPSILAKKMELVDKLLSFLPRDAVIDDPRETLAYECDALSAYRCHQWLRCYLALLKR